MVLEDWLELASPRDLERLAAYLGLTPGSILPGESEHAYKRRLAGRIARARGPAFTPRRTTGYY